MSRLSSGLGLAGGFAAAFVLTRALWPSPEPAPPALAAEARNVSSESPKVQADLAPPMGQESPAAKETKDSVAAGVEPVPDIDAAVPAETAERPPGTVVCGIVTDGEGAPCGDAYLTVNLHGGDDLIAKADGEGRFTIGPLQPGKHELRAGARGFRSESTILDLAPGDDLLRKDFALLAKQVIQVRLVTPDGEPAIAALAAAGKHTFQIGLVPVATIENPGDTFIGVTGSLNNTFGAGSFWQAGFGGGTPSLGPDHYGSVTVHDRGAGWLSLVCAHQVLEAQPIDESTDEVVFRVSAGDIEALYGSIHVHVQDGETGQPVEADVWAESEPFVMGKPTGRTDAAGEALLGEVQPGERWLHVRAEGYAHHSRELLLERGGVLTLEVALQPPIEIAGVVTDGGKPRSGATVTWGLLDERTGAIEWAERTSAGTDEEGRFGIANKAPGLYVVRAKVEPRSQSAAGGSKATALVRADARLGSALGLELDLRDTAALVVAHAVTEKPYPRALILNADGHHVASARPGHPGLGGEDTVRVLPGSYTVVLNRDGVEPQVVEVKLGAEGQRIDFE